jgi:CheY-like chemotaxis protein
MPERILVVDDNQDAADMLAHWLKQYGFETRAVYGGEQAIDLVEEFEPDMVLLDIGMPGLNGFETASRLRAKRTNVHLIVVALTGYSSVDAKEQAYASGFDLHICKPMTAEKLQELIALLDPTGDHSDSP